MRTLDETKNGQLVPRKEQTVIPGLDASAPQPLSFAPSTHLRDFLLQPPQGNLLIY